MNDTEPSKLSKSEIATFRADQREADHWRWLWKLLKRLALWIAGLATGAHAIYVAWRDVFK